MYPPSTPDPNQPSSQPYGTPPPGYPPSQPYGAPPSQPYAAPPPGYPMGQPYAVPMMVPASPKTNGLAVTSLVLGIIGAVLAFCPLGGEFIAPLLGILAIIFGAVGLNQVRSGMFSKGSRGMAIAGLVTGVVALLFDVIAFIIIAGAISGAAAGAGH